MADDWISTREAAKLSGYHIEHIGRLIRAGELKARKVVTVWLVSRSNLKDYLQRQDQKGERRGRKPH